MVVGRKKAICFFVIFLFVNISGLAKNEKSQDEKFENYVVLENENNTGIVPKYEVKKLEELFKIL